MKGLKKVLFVILLTIIGLTVYFNIGSYFQKTYMEIVTHQKYPSELDEILVVGHHWCLVSEKSTPETVENDEFWNVVLWPLIMILSIGSWIIYYIFQAGILKLMGIEFLAPLTLLFFGALTYYLIRTFRKNKK